MKATTQKIFSMRGSTLFLTASGIMFSFFLVSFGIVSAQTIPPINAPEEVVVEEAVISENSAPVITLNEATVSTYGTNEEYVDPGFSAYDAEEGDVTDRVVVGGDVVSLSTPRTYAITYSVSDSTGLEGQVAIRMVTVELEQNLMCEVTPGELSLNARYFEIYNESIEVVNDTAVVVEWETNLQSHSVVYYGTVPYVRTYEEGAGNPGYERATNETHVLTSKHGVLINDLVPQMTYYFMPSGVRADDAVLGAQLSCRSETSVHVMSVQSSVTTAEEAQCEARINTYLRRGDTNDADEVHTLQMFLRDIEGMDLEVTDVFDEATERAVNKFQIKYKEEILMPWGISEPTGYVYYTTQRKVNEISCNGGSASLTGEQLAEIAAYRKLVDTYPDVDTSIVGLEDSDNNDDGALAITDDDDGEGVVAAVSSALKGLEVSNTVKFLGFLILLIIFVTLVTNHRKMQNSLAKNEWVSKLKNRVK